MPEGDVVGLVEQITSVHEVQAPVAGTIQTFLRENEDALLASRALASLDRVA